MFCEGGEGSREVWDEAVRGCGYGYVFFLGCERVSEGRMGGSGV